MGQVDIMGQVDVMGYAIDNVWWDTRNKKILQVQGRTKIQIRWRCLNYNFMKA